MATIELRNIWHSYEGLQEDDTKTKYVLENINITYKDGAAVALLGPSGCGKTTLLEIISGLLIPTKGQVLFDGVDVTNLSARQRHIAQVFQFPVVYESMSVYGNIAFPLKNDGLDPGKINKRVLEVADIMEITNLLNFSVTKLTSADKQRVSLARGIVRPDTAAVLLDEPLTVIDPKAQWGLRRKLKQIQKELNFTMIYVTHDQHEALTFAEEVTIMQAGHINQNASPVELHENPETTFVGYFIGSPGMNIFDVNVSKDGIVAFQGTSLKISEEIAKQLYEIEDSLQLGIRPEYITTHVSTKDNCISGKVKLVDDNGAYQIITTIFDEINIKSRLAESVEVKVGDTVWLEFNQDQIKFFKEGQRISFNK